MIRTWAVVVGSVGLFLAAAKFHGWALRQEREAWGVTHVVFGGQNPPRVEALWRAERVRFWVMVPALAVALGAGAAWRGRSRATLAVAALLWAPSVAFVALGAASVQRRTGSAASSNP